MTNPNSRNSYNDWDTWHAIQDANFDREKREEREARFGEHIHTGPGDAPVGERNGQPSGRG